MDRKTAWQRVSMMATTVVMAGFGFTGLVSADSISNTGPDSINKITTSQTNTCTVTNTNNLSINNSNTQNALSGSVTTGGNTSSDSTYWNGWSDLDPALAQNAGTSFGDWWSGLNTWMTAHGDATQWSGNGDNSSWTPSGDNWQSTWANWDPALWQSNGQSFDNWDTQLTTYLNDGASNWMLTWPGDGGNTEAGNSTSGAATNTNSFNVLVKIVNNATPSDSCGVAGLPSGGGSISNTGPGSTNKITSSAPTTSTYKNSNKVWYGNGNKQYAYTGPVTSSGNTGTGQASSGPAANNNAAAGSVGVANSAPIGIGGGGPIAPPASSSIGTTGPDSTNEISSSSRTVTTVTNTNSVAYNNSNNQTALSGSATSNGNTSVGSGATGAATNANDANGGIDVNN